MAVQVGQPIIRTKGARCACLLARGGGIQERAPFPAARKRSFRRDPVFLAGRPGQPSHHPGQSGNCPIALDRQANGSPAARHYYHSTFYSDPAFRAGLPPLVLFERNRQAHTRDFQVESEQGFPASQPAARLALQTPAAPILRRNALTGRVPDNGQAQRRASPHPIHPGHLNRPAARRAAWLTPVTGAYFPGPASAGHAHAPSSPPTRDWTNRRKG